MCTGAHTVILLFFLRYNIVFISCAAIVRSAGGVRASIRCTGRIRAFITNIIIMADGLNGENFLGIKTNTARIKKDRVRFPFTSSTRTRRFESERFS